MGIAAELVRFRAMSLEERARIVEERCSRFRQRFAPHAIFERAGVFSSGILRGTRAIVTGAPTSASVSASASAYATTSASALSTASASASASSALSVQEHREKTPRARCGEKVATRKSPHRCLLHLLFDSFKYCMLKNTTTSGQLKISNP